MRFTNNSLDPGLSVTHRTKAEHHGKALNKASLKTRTESLARDLNDNFLDWLHLNTIAFDISSNSDTPFHFDHNRDVTRSLSSYRVRGSRECAFPNNDGKTRVMYSIGLLPPL